MATNNNQGRMIALVIGVYLVAKAVLNMILGAGFGDIIIGAVITFALFTGLRFVNFAAAAYLVIIALIHLPDNISHISSNWIYLTEGIADIACAVALVLHKDIKEHFTNEWSEIGSLFNK